MYDMQEKLANGKESWFLYSSLLDRIGNSNRIATELILQLLRGVLILPTFERFLADL